MSMQHMLSGKESQDDPFHLPDWVTRNCHLAEKQSGYPTWTIRRTLCWARLGCLFVENTPVVHLGNVTLSECDVSGKKRYKSVEACINNLFRPTDCSTPSFFFLLVVMLNLFIRDLCRPFRADCIHDTFSALCSKVTSFGVQYWLQFHWQTIPKETLMENRNGCTISAFGVSSLRIRSIFLQKLQERRDMWVMDNNAGFIREQRLFQMSSSGCLLRMGLPSRDFLKSWLNSRVLQFTESGWSSLGIAMGQPL